MKSKLSFFVGHYFLRALALSGCLFLASCSSLESFYTAPNQAQYTGGRGCQKSDVSVPKNVVVRKSFLSKQILKPSAPRKQISFQIDDPVDLRRRMLLSVKQGPKTINRLKVWANGQLVQTFLPDSAMLLNDVPNMVADLCPYLVQGSNKLELEVIGHQEGTAELLIDGFMLPAEIPEALHSFVAPPIVPATVKTVLSLKFLEGMKVRLNKQVPVEEQLVEQADISLYPLRVFIKQFSIREIQADFLGTPEEEDLLEAERQADGSEKPNGNTMYSIIFESKDIKTLTSMMVILRGMPFFESIGVNNSALIGPASH